jgi:cupin fold WbuC family metalloprotein
MSRMVKVDGQALESLVEEARRSPRLRMNRNLHAMDDPVHRMLNATEPGTYVRPHRHADPPRDETLSVLRGRGAIVEFDDDGAVVEVAVLEPRGAVSAVDLRAGCWHTLVALEPGTVWLEAKAGPYVSPGPADRAAWAPEEGDAAGAARFLDDMRRIISRACGH